MSRTTMKQAASLVAAKKAFKASSVFAENKNNLYIVYSYGYHWPLFVYEYETSTWYENQDKFSPTTSKHASQLRPTANTVKIPLTMLKQLIED